MHFDFAATINNRITSMKKMEIDSIQSIDIVKQRARNILTQFVKYANNIYSKESILEISSTTMHTLQVFGRDGRTFH